MRAGLWPVGDLAPWGRNCGSGEELELCGCLGLISAEPRSPVTQDPQRSVSLCGVWAPAKVAGTPHGVKGVGKASPEMVRAS